MAIPDFNPALSSFNRDWRNAEGYSALLEEMAAEREAKLQYELEREREMAIAAQEAQRLMAGPRYTSAGDMSDPATIDRYVWQPLRQKYNIPEPHLATQTRQATPSKSSDKEITYEVPIAWDGEKNAPSRMIERTAEEVARDFDVLPDFAKSDPGVVMAMRDWAFEQAKKQVASTARAPGYPEEAGTVSLSGGGRGFMGAPGGPNILSQWVSSGMSPQAAPDQKMTDLGVPVGAPSMNMQFGNDLFTAPQLAQPAPAMQPTASEMPQYAEMTNPSGKTVRVPISRVSEALSKGYRRK